MAPAVDWIFWEEIPKEMRTCQTSSELCLKEKVQRKKSNKCIILVAFKMVFECLTLMVFQNFQNNGKKDPWLIAYFGMANKNNIIWSSQSQMLFILIQLLHASKPASSKRSKPFTAKFSRLSQPSGRFWKSMKRPATDRWADLKILPMCLLGSKAQGVWCLTARTFIELAFLEVSQVKPVGFPRSKSWFILLK